VTPRRKRLLAVVAIVAGVGAATALATLAFQDNLLYFYNPTRCSRGCAGRPDIPDCGMVTKGSLKRTDGTLEIRFVVTITSTDPGAIRGTPADLSAKGRVVAHGQMTSW
jgi:cytochrome c-type biogenesis protein CcmE